MMARRAALLTLISHDTFTLITTTQESMEAPPSWNQFVELVSLSPEYAFDDGVVWEDSIVGLSTNGALSVRLDQHHLPCISSSQEMRLQFMTTVSPRHQHSDVLGKLWSLSNRNLAGATL